MSSTRARRAIPEPRVRDCAGDAIASLSFRTRVMLRCCVVGAAVVAGTCGQQRALLVRTQQKHVTNQQTRMIVLIIPRRSKAVSARFTTQRSSSCRNSPLGIAVPGLICAGSRSQRNVQSGFSRSPANRKFGAIALASRAGSPVM